MKTTFDPKRLTELFANDIVRDQEMVYLTVNTFRTMAAAIGQNLPSVAGQLSGIADNYANNTAGVMFESSKAANILTGNGRIGRKLRHLIEVQDYVFNTPRNDKETNDLLSSFDEQFNFKPKYHDKYEKFHEMQQLMVDIRMAIVVTPEINQEGDQTIVKIPSTNNSEIGIRVGLKQGYPYLEYYHPCESMWFANDFLYVDGVYEKVLVEAQKIFDKHNLSKDIDGEVFQDILTIFHQLKEETIADDEVYNKTLKRLRQRFNSYVLEVTPVGINEETGKHQYFCQLLQSESWGGHSFRVDKEHPFLINKIGAMMRDKLLSLLAQQQALVDISNQPVAQETPALPFADAFDKAKPV